jgi:hypothetical protein
MMASVAKGQMSAKAAVAKADSDINAIFQKWRVKGLIGGGS